MKNWIRGILRHLGYDITRRNFLRSHAMRRQKLIRDREISLILDVGANEGQYARMIRDDGYRARIISFEPLSEAFQNLKAIAAHDPNWEVRNAALGAERGRSEIHVTGFSQVSSLLPATGISNTDHWKSQKTETIEVFRLDDLFDELVRPQETVAMKLDVQGYEHNVLAGASQSLPGIDLLEMELSVEEMYVGETLMPEMLQFLDSLGFRLVSLQEVHVHPQTGRVLQYDGLFLRQE